MQRPLYVHTRCAVSVWMSQAPCVADWMSVCQTQTDMQAHTDPDGRTDMDADSRSAVSRMTKLIDQLSIGLSSVHSGYKAVSSAVDQWPQYSQDHIPAAVWHTGDYKTAAEKQYGGLTLLLFCDTFSQRVSERQVDLTSHSVNT